jgi:hypothetical protein
MEILQRGCFVSFATHFAWPGGAAELLRMMVGTKSARASCMKDKADRLIGLALTMKVSLSSNRHLKEMYRQMFQAQRGSSRSEAINPDHTRLKTKVILAHKAYDVSLVRRCR